MCWGNPIPKFPMSYLFLSRECSNSFLEQDLKPQGKMLFEQLLTPPLPSGRSVLQMVV